MEDTIRHVCETAQHATAGTTVHASTISFNANHYASTQDFKNNLMNQYGFDQQIADLMWKLYQNIKAKEGKNADYVFNRIMGGAIEDYNDWTWDSTAGKIGISFLNTMNLRR